MKEKQGIKFKTGNITHEWHEGLRLERRHIDTLIEALSTPTMPDNTREESTPEKLNRIDRERSDANLEQLRELKKEVTPPQEEKPKEFYSDSVGTIIMDDNAIENHKLNDRFTPPNKQPEEKQLCVHNGKCLDSASGIHCSEWEINYCDGTEYAEQPEAWEEELNTENWHAIEGANGKCACGDGIGNCHTQLKSFITKTLTSRDTYWKEKVRKVVQENLDKHCIYDVGADALLDNLK